MKIGLFLTLSLLASIVIPSSLDAAFFTGSGLATKMPVRGQVDSAVQTWGGKLITNFDLILTPLSSTPSSELYFDNQTNTFSGFVVLTAACMTADCSDGAGRYHESAYLTFSHGVDGSEVRFAGSENDTTLTLTGFAWSHSSGWVAFGVGSDPVKYDRSTGFFSGFAWSQNLGYISFNGLNMTSNIPKLVPHNPKVIVAHNQKAIGANLGNAAAEGYNSYTLSIQKWDDNAFQYLTSTTGEFLSVDLRQAKSYEYTLTDPYGNTDTGPLTVVAGVPTKFSQNGIQIMSPEQGSAFSYSASSVVPANGYSEYAFHINLHDIYGNPVISEPGIKEVSYTLQFENTIKPNQTDLADLTDATGVGRSIAFTGASGSPLVQALELRRKISNYTQSTYSVTMTGSEKDEVSVVSYLPTDFSNTFKYLSGSVSVTKLNTAIPSVGELATTQFSDSSLGDLINGTPYEFAQSWSGSFSLSGALGSDVFGVNIPFTTRANYTEGGETGFRNTTEHVYRFYTGAVDYNFLQLDSDFGRENEDGGKYYYYSGPKGNIQLFDLMPKLTSKVDLGFSIDHQAIRFVSLPDSGTGAYVIGSATSVDANANRGIKILGAAGGASESFFALNSSDTYARAGDFRKPQVRDLIRQNVEEIKRKTLTGVLVKSGDYTLDVTDFANQTIIVDGGNLTIDTNDFGSGSSSPKAIIVLGGDVIISSDVSSIYASIYTDRGIRNNGDSTQQLYIYGTVISGNTIGTSAVASSLICPDFLTSPCSDADKKKYDLNFLRIGPKTLSSGLGGRHADHPLVIEYDPALLSNLPPGLKKVSR